MPTSNSSASIRILQPRSAQAPQAPGLAFGERGRLLRERDDLRAENARLAAEVERLRQDNKALRESAEIWIRLYENQLSRANRTAELLALIGLGRELTRRGAAAEAEPFLRRAAQSRSSRLGENDPRTAEAHVRLGACLAALGRSDEARTLLVAARAQLQNEPRFRSEFEEAGHLLGGQTVKRESWCG